MDSESATNYDALHDPPGESRIVHGINHEEISLSILQKYVLKEWFWATLAVSVLLLVMLMGAYMGNLVNDIADGRMPAGLLGTLLILHLPSLLNTILPLAAFIAVLWVLGRLYGDQEMAVMRSSGFGWKKLLWPLLNLTLPLAAVLLVLGLDVTPTAARMAERQLEMAFRSATLWGLQPGKFHVLKHGDLVVYAGSIDADGRTLRNIFIKQLRQGREQVWVAKKGRYWVDQKSGGHFLSLEQGKVTDMARNRPDVRVLDFERNDLRLPQPEYRKDSDAVSHAPSLQLLREGNPHAFAEFQWRISPAISAMVLALLAIPLAHSEPREGRGVRIVLGVLVYLLYGNILFLCRSWVAEGVVPTVIGIWWVHLAFLILAFAWIRKQGRFAGQGAAA